MTSNYKRVRFVCISDTHNKAPGEGYTLPAGDVLVHAGDLTNEGAYHELKRVAEWIEKTDFAVKIVVAGEAWTLIFAPLIEAMCLCCVGGLVQETMISH